MSTIPELPSVDELLEPMLDALPPDLLAEVREALAAYYGGGNDVLPAVVGNRVKTIKRVPNASQAGRTPALDRLPRHLKSMMSDAIAMQGHNRRKKFAALFPGLANTRVIR